MKFDVPLLKQSTNKTCGNTCLRIVLSYYGYKISEETISNKISKDNKGGTWLTELGWFAKTLDLKPTCYAYNLYLTNPSKDKYLLPRALANKFERQRKSLKDDWFSGMLNSTIKAISSGVSYIIEKPHEDLFKDYLRQSVPIILSVNCSSLYDKQGDPFEGHDIVLNGFEKDYFWFVDPDHRIQNKIRANQLMFALLSAKVVARSAYMLTIKK